MSQHKQGAVTAAPPAAQAEKAHPLPAALAGDEQQSAAIARVLAMKHELMTLAEFTNAPASKTVGDVRTVMNEAADHGLVVIVATHQIGLARSADRDAAFGREGILTAGSLEQLMATPRHDRSRQRQRRIAVHG